jgi:hypothetical protein
VAGSTSFDRDLGFDRLMTTFELNSKESYVNVGFLSSSGMHKNSDMTVAAIAAVHEFGSSDGHIPERSFMRSAIAQNKNQIQTMIDKLAAKVADGQMQRDRALGIIGQYIKDRIVSKINTGPFQELAKSTIDRKGSSKPLIDTGQMKQSVDWEIVKR